MSAGLPHEPKPVPKLGSGAIRCLAFDVRFGSQADMAPTARVDHKVQKPPATITKLIPTPPFTLKLAPPIPNAQACRRALADCTE